MNKQIGYLSGHAKLLLDGATIAVKVPVGSSHYPLAGFGVILHYTLHTTDQISNMSVCMRVRAWSSSLQTPEHDCTETSHALDVHVAVM